MSRARARHSWRRSSTGRRCSPGSDLGAMPTVVVSEPSAVAAAGARLGDVPLATWKAWLAFRFVSDHAQYPAQGVRRRAFRFLQPHAARRADAERPLEARRAAARRRSSARRWGSSTSSNIGRRTPRKQMAELIEDLRAGLCRQDRSCAVDGRRDAQGRARKARDLRSADRASGQIISTILSMAGERGPNPLANAVGVGPCSNGGCSLSRPGQAGRPHACGT